MSQKLAASKLGSGIRSYYVYRVPTNVWKLHTSCMLRAGIILHRTCSRDIHHIKDFMIKEEHEGRKPQIGNLSTLHLRWQTDYLWGASFLRVIQLNTCPLYRRENALFKCRQNSLPRSKNCILTLLHHGSKTERAAMRIIFLSRSSVCFSPSKPSLCWAFWAAHAVLRGWQDLTKSSRSRCSQTLQHCCTFAPKCRRHQDTSRHIDRIIMDLCLRFDVSG